MYTHDLQRIQYEFLFVERVRGLAVRSFLTFEFFGMSSIVKPFSGENTKRKQ